MVDLAQALSEIKSLPDHALQRELKSPSGSIPGWLALGEIHERKRIRATTGGTDPNKRPSMAEEYAGNVQPIFAGAGMRPQSVPQPQAAMSPFPPRQQGGIAGLPPPAQAGLATMPQAQAPQGYHDGGIVRLAGGGVVYANQRAIRNQQVTQALQAQLQEAIANVYGPGYTAQIYSGGQSGERRTGSVRHNEGRAADIHVIGPDGQKVSGDALAPLGQYWAAKKYGGVGMEMHGGGIHLDEWAQPPQGGGMAWNYANEGGQYTAAQKAAIEAGLAGQMPTLYGGGAQQVAAGGSQADQIMAGLVKRGMPQHIAQGFVMNFQDESGLNSGIQEVNPTAGRGGFGLYQLTGPRRVAYENYAKGLGVPLSDTDAQLDFMMSELSGSEANAAKLIYAQPDAPHAAAAIVNNFLRPAPEYAASRTANYLSGNVPVALAAADTAGKLGATEGAEKGDPMSQYYLMQQLLAPKPVAQAPVPAPAQIVPGRPVDASQFVQNPEFMRRRTYGLA